MSAYTSLIQVQFVQDLVWLIHAKTLSQIHNSACDALVLEATGQHSVYDGAFYRDSEEKGAVHVFGATELLQSLQLLTL